jgi:hypothetical protein
VGTEPIFHYTGVCFLQKFPQVALNPHCLPSSVCALQRKAACGTILPFFATATATVSAGLGTSLVTKSFGRAAIKARDFSLALRAVSAIFSGSGCPDLIAAIRSFCHSSFPCPSGLGKTARGADGGGRGRRRWAIV